MAALDTTNVIAVSFSVNTTVTAPDGNTYTASANLRYGVPAGQTSMTVGVTTPVMCQTSSVPKFSTGHGAQVFVVDEVRTPV